MTRHRAADGRALGHVRGDRPGLGAARSGDEARPLPGLGLLAAETRELFDAEVRRIVDECYARALGLLRTHRDQLDALVAALLEQETLDEAEAYRIAGIERPTVSGNGAGPALA